MFFIVCLSRPRYHLSNTIHGKQQINRAIWKVKVRARELLTDTICCSTISACQGISPCTYFTFQGVHTDCTENHPVGSLPATNLLISLLPYFFCTDIKMKWIIGWYCYKLMIESRWYKVFILCNANWKKTSCLSRVLTLKNVYRLVNLWKCYCKVQV